MVLTTFEGGEKDVCVHFVPGTLLEPVRIDVTLSPFRFPASVSVMLSFMLVWILVLIYSQVSFTGKKNYRFVCALASRIHKYWCCAARRGAFTDKQVPPPCERAGGCE